MSKKETALLRNKKKTHAKIKKSAGKKSTMWPFVCSAILRFFFCISAYFHFISLVSFFSYFILSRPFGSESSGVDSFCLTLKNDWLKPDPLVTKLCTYFLRACFFYGVLFDDRVAGSFPPIYPERFAFVPNTKRYFNSSRNKTRDGKRSQTNYTRR